MDPLMTTIMGWGPNWAPRGWSLCEGQLLAISQFTAIFSLVGTIYGGDGRTTFGLPDLRSRVPLGQGQGAGLSYYPIGSRGGAETVTLRIQEMPAHNHAAAFTGGAMSGGISIPAVSGDGNTNSPSPSVHLAKGVVPAGLASNPGNIYSNGAVDTTLGTNIPFSGVPTGTVVTGNTGGGQAHENRMPFQAISWIFALQGVFPSRN